MFGLFKKKGTTGTPPASETPRPALGWEAIERAFESRYHGQKPRWWEHHGVHAAHDLGTPPENPLEAVAIYNAGTFWHYVGFGLSDLFAKTSEGDWSGFGYEFTFRLAKENGADAPLWPVNILVSLAKAQYAGSNFAPGHSIKVGPIDGQPETRLTALLVAKDPSFELQQTPHGKLAFLLLLGVEDEVRERALRDGSEPVLEEIAKTNPDLVTRLS